MKMLRKLRKQRPFLEQDIFMFYLLVQQDGVLILVSQLLLVEKRSPQVCGFFWVLAYSC